MVATRRGVRVNSQNTEQNEPSVSTATPATRATRRRAVREELTSDSQRKGGEGGSTAASPEIKGSTAKRKSRSSKRQLRNEDQPDSMHEADVSESESCCSAVSGLQAPADAQGPRRRRRGALPLQKTSSGMDQDVHSEAESCCSSASAQQGSSTRRATRSRQMSTPMEGRPVKLANANNENSEAESCSSAVSGTKVLTRSQKRITLSRASSKSRTEDTEISEVDSCSSSVSGLQQSTLRKSARSRRGRAVQPVPLCLEENADGSPWPRRQTRGSRVKLESAKEPQSHDSEGFESGPSATPRRSTRGQTASTHQGQLILSDSESEATDVCSPVGSPSSLRGKGTPCSSRTGSGSSARALVVPPIAPKALNVLKEQDDGEASASSDQLVSDLPKNLEEERTESGTADGLLDSASQPETVTETAEPKAKEAVAMVADSHVSLECSLTEEVSEDDKTLIAEGEECVCAAPVTMDDKAEPQMVEDAAQVNLCESGRLTSKDDTVAPGMFEEKANKDEQLHMTEDIVPPSPAVKVIVSCAAVSEGKEVEDGAMETDSTVATVCEKLQGVCEKDNSLAEESDGVTVEVAESTELHIEQKAGHSLSLTDSTVATVCEKLQGVCEKDNSLAEESDGVTVEVAEDTEPHIEPKAGHSLSLTLLDSSDEEAENSDSGHSGRESGDEKDSEGSDMDTEIMCVDENLAGPSKPQAASPVMANDGLFVIDTLPGCHSDGKYYLDQEKMGEDKGVVGEQCDDIEDEQDEEFVDEEGDEDEDAEDSFLFKSKSKDPVKLSTSIDPGLKVKDIGGLYISVNGIKSKGTSNAMKKSKEQKDHERLMQKCVIGPDFEKKDSVPPYKESKQAMKLKRKEEKEKTTGDGWFNMKAPEMTEELTNDLKVLKMRAAMDPKRFYKKNDRDGFPKYFQVGTVVDSPVDFYHSRIPKKQRKRTMVEELLADAEFRNYNKKKYKQIMAEKAALAAGKKNRKKNKFCKKQGI